MKKELTFDEAVIESNNGTEVYIETITYKGKRFNRFEMDIKETLSDKMINGFCDEDSIKYAIRRLLEGRSVYFKEEAIKIFGDKLIE